MPKEFRESHTYNTTRIVTQAPRFIRLPGEFNYLSGVKSRYTSRPVPLSDFVITGPTHVFTSQLDHIMSSWSVYLREPAAFQINYAQSNSTRRTELRWIPQNPLNPGLMLHHYLHLISHQPLPNIYEGQERTIYLTKFPHLHRMFLNSTILPRQCLQHAVLK